MIIIQTIDNCTDERLLYRLGNKQLKVIANYTDDL